MKKGLGVGGRGEPVSSETSGFILFIEWKLEKVHIVKIECIQHEHTHTHSKKKKFFFLHAGDTPAPNDALATVVIGF